jgi:type VI secretion system secreted protein VgrG
MAGATPDFVFEPEALGADALRVVRFHGVEAISRLFEYDVALASRDEAIDPADLVGKAATLRIRSTEEDRAVIGIVRRFEQTGGGRGFHYYRALLVPQPWLLGLRRQSQIFMGDGVVDIAAALFDAAGLPADTLRKALDRTPVARNFCVQYSESDLAFFSRLMEEEGICFFFEPKDGKMAMVLADHPEKHPDVPVNAVLPFRETGAGMNDPDEVRAFRPVHRLRPGKVSLLDWDFKKPSKGLLGEKEAVASSLLLNEWPGSFPNEGIGAEIAAMRLEEERAETEAAEGESTARWLSAGFRFTLADHPQPDRNRAYLVTSLECWGSQPDAAEVDAGAGEAPLFRNVFTCIPADVRFRPRRATPVPRIHGLQTATVVGPEGSEIHCDEYGRVKVRFPWDRSDRTGENTSSWIRVSQSWGGASWGSMFIPRVGQEVIVEFMGGDPNRPIITGRLYNGDHPVQYALPTMKTKSTISSATTSGGPGANEIRFEDAAGKEEIMVNASRDILIQVDANRTESVGSSEMLSVGGNRTMSIGGDHDVTVMRSRDELVAGNDSLHVVGMQILAFLQGGGTTVGGDKSEEVGTALSEIIAGSKSTSVDGNLERTVGAASVEVLKGGKSISAGSLHSRTSGADLINVKGDRTESTSGASVTTVGGILNADVGGSFSIDAGGSVSITTALAKIEAKTKVILQCGDSVMTIDGGGVTLKSSAIKITASGAIKFTGTPATAD